MRAMPFPRSIRIAREWASHLILVLDRDPCLDLGRGRPDRGPHVRDPHGLGHVRLDRRFGPRRDGAGGPVEAGAPRCRCGRSSDTLSVSGETPDCPVTWISSLPRSSSSAISLRRLFSR